MKKEFLEIGRIVGVHGIKGVLKVQYWCDDAQFFCGFKNFYFNSLEKKETEFAKPHGNIVLLKFKDISNIETAETLRGRVLFIKREDAVLEEGRHFVEEIVGCSVFDSNSGEILGIIKDVSQNPANDIWHIEKDNKEYLFPAVDEYISSVDIESEKVFITPPKGIFDDED